MRIGKSFEINRHQNYLYGGPIKKSWHFSTREAIRAGQDLGHLDIGCGSGYYLNFINSSRGIGIDLDENAIRHVSEHFIKFNCALQDLPVEYSDFGLISIFEVIEHVDDTTRFLKDIHRRLSDDGILIGSTPNKTRLWARIFGYESFDYPPNHLHRFSAEELKHLLVNCGFKKIEIRSAFLIPKMGDIIFRSKEICKNSKFFSWMLFPLVAVFLSLSNLTKNGYLHHGFTARR